MTTGSTNPNLKIQNTEETKSFADIYSTLDEAALTHGASIENVETRSLELCRVYIGGSWTAARGPEDLEVKRIAGGFTNQLYKIALKDTVPKVANSIYPEEPRVVAIKYYQAKHLHNFTANESERLSDIITLTVLSEVGLGPKVFGIFADGFIQEFCEHEQFRVKHQQQPELVRKLMNHLARINYLNVPVRKQNNWLLEEMRSLVAEAFANPEVPALIQKLKLELLKTRDLSKDVEEFGTILQELGAPKVFCHNDFRGSNVLVSTKNQSMKFVDLEYSSYGSRGNDIATIILEWNHDRFAYEDLSLPSNELIDSLVGLYREECDKLMPGYCAKPENSLLKMRNEVKFGVLQQFLFMGCFMLGQNESFIDAIPFDRAMNLKFVENALKSYLDAKEQLIKEGIIKPNN